MSLGAVSFSGLTSGVDWRSMIDQLIQVDHKRVELVSNRKSTQESKLKAWQELTGKLQALKLSAEALRKSSAFNVFQTDLRSSSSTDAGTLVVATASENAVPGTHELQVLQTAQAQKVSSKSFTSRKEALGASYAGSFLLGGRLLTVEATDTLETLRDRINSLNSGADTSGVIASIVSYSASDHRLLLTSQNQGAQGMDLRAVGASDLLSLFGFTTSSSMIENPTSDGAASASFRSATSSVASLLGISGSVQGTVTIGGQELTLDLSSSLSEMAFQIDALEGVSAQVLSEISSDGLTTYRLDISGTTSFVDDQNVLHTLGILSNTFGSVNELHRSDRNLTKVGGGYVDATTTWAQVDTGGGANNIADGDTITIVGRSHDGGEVTLTYTINNRETDTIQGLLDAIETALGNVTASVTSDGKLQVLDDVSGTSALWVELRANNEGGGDLDLGTFSAMEKGYNMEVTEGRDALLMVDGGYVTQISNTIEDVLPGITLDLLRAEQGTIITLDVKRDTGSIAGKLQDFVTKYNAVMDFIITQSSYDQDKKRTGGPLFGEGTLSSVKGELMGNLVAPVWGVSQEFSIPAMVGITLDNQGKLSLDQTKLKGLLASNFEDVKRLFLPAGTTSSSLLTYVGYGSKTRPGSYQVNITQVAARASVTGTVDLSGGLGGDEVLSVSTGSSSARVQLSSGMTLTDVVAAVNQQLQSSYAQVLVGDARLYRDSSQSQPISDSTPWDQIYDAAGQPAGLQDGDVIRFSGTDRRGRTVSGTYTITSAGTDTVRGLLSAIENAFGNQVSASIDSFGRIRVADRTVGPSGLSLTITGPEGRGLDFGTVDVDPDGSDGSSQGRYAIPVVASASEDGRYLILTHTSYGSSQSFSVTQQNGLVLGSGVDGSYFGVDVAGTINGEAATGAGRILRGNSGQSNVDGLSVMYTGTETGEVGSVTLTLGVAEGFYRSIFQMVDSFEGYITNKQDSLKRYIDRLEDQIADMEAQLERKRSRMVQQFVAMEKVVSKLQTQMSWLGQQVQKLGK